MGNCKLVGFAYSTILERKLTMLNYKDLSRHDRRAARRLAKELLRTVPAAQEPDEPRSIRGALSTAFMKPENVIGALVYTTATVIGGEMSHLTRAKNVSNWVPRSKLRRDHMMMHLDM